MRSTKILTLDFFDTDAGHFAWGAKQFLEAARVLNDTEDDVVKTLRKPTLHLAGHELELMLKSSFCLNDRKPPTKGPDGHNIVKLWHAGECELDARKNLPVISAF